MKAHRPFNDLLGDNRPPQPQRRVLLVAAAILGMIVLFVLLASGESEDEELEAAGEINRLDSPKASRRGALNRPKVPGTQQLEGESSLRENDSDPLHVVGKLKRNETLFVALRNKSLEPDRIQPVVSSMSEVFDFRRSRPGDRFEAHLDLDGNILKFRYQVSREDIYLAQLIGDRYVAEKVEVPRTTRVERLEGIVTTSLYLALQAIGEDGDLASRFMDLFAYDFDFGTDSRNGDRFRMLVEKIYLDGEFYKYGNILVAEYVSSEKAATFQAFFFAPDEDKDGEYYDAEGYSIRRAFLKVPVPGARMTSVFNLKRYHPILKRYRPHHGVDYAAPTGTPVLAVADGTLSFVGWKGGNGNFIVLKHDPPYESVYAHLSRFRSGLKKGAQVKQKDIIGYVGSTGLSTGPHLHFGIKRNGKWVDPMSLDTSRGNQLQGSLRRRFDEDRERRLAQLDGTLPLDPEQSTQPAPPPAPTPPVEAPQE